MKINEAFDNCPRCNRAILPDYTNTRCLCGMDNALQQISLGRYTISFTNKETTVIKWVESYVEPFSISPNSPFFDLFITLYGKEGIERDKEYAITIHSWRYDIELADIDKLMVLR